MFFSRARSWAVQRVSNLGLVALLCLMFFALWYDSAAEDSPQRDHRSGSRQPYRGKFKHHRAELSTSQLIFVYYTLIAHFVGLLFPIRLCWAVRSITANLRKVALQVQPQVTQTKPISGKLAWKLPRSNESVSSYEDSISSDQSESDIELSTSTSIESWEDETLIHSIILPNYKEDMDTLRETLDVLACHALASASYEARLTYLSSCLQPEADGSSRFISLWKRARLVGNPKLRSLRKNMVLNSGALSTPCTREIFREKLRAKAAI